MGPTLYDSAPHYKNLVRSDGAEARDGDEAFFLHSDMLHEAPQCHGIVHDAETVRFEPKCVTIKTSSSKESPVMRKLR